MSPEQAGGLVATHKSDIFSFGAVVYRTLTGEPAFAAEDTPQTLYQVVYRNPMRPSALTRGLPPDVDLVLAIALAKDEADRFDSALDMAGAMRLAARGALDPQRRLHATTLLAALPWGTAAGARDSSMRTCGGRALAVGCGADGRLKGSAGSVVAGVAHRRAVGRRRSRRPSACRRPSPALLAPAEIVEARSPGTRSAGRSLRRCTRCPPCRAGTRRSRTGRPGRSTSPTGT